MKELKIKEYYFNCDCGSKQCGKLKIIDFRDGFFEVCWIKYPNRKKAEGCIMLYDPSVKRLMKLLTQANEEAN